MVLSIQGLVPARLNKKEVKLFKLLKLYFKPRLQFWIENIWNFGSIKDEMLKNFFFPEFLFYSTLPYRDMMRKTCLGPQQLVLDDYLKKLKKNLFPPSSSAEQIGITNRLQDKTCYIEWLVIS